MFQKKLYLTLLLGLLVAAFVPVTAFAAPPAEIQPWPEDVTHPVQPFDIAPMDVPFDMTLSFRPVLSGPVDVSGLINVKTDDVTATAASVTSIEAVYSSLVLMVGLGWFVAVMRGWRRGIRM